MLKKELVLELKKQHKLLDNLLNEINNELNETD
jgi:hypothetical protein